MKNIAKLSSHIDGLAAAKRFAEQQLDAAIGTLGVAHEHFVKAAEHVAAISGGDGSSGALGELADYVQVTRQITAEAVLALSRLRPEYPLGKDAKVRDMIADARAGMQVKRLAKWEADALREAVVEGLAGETTKP